MSANSKLSFNFSFHQWIPGYPWPVGDWSSRRVVSTSSKRGGDFQLIEALEDSGFDLIFRKKNKQTKEKRDTFMFIFFESLGSIEFLSTKTIKMQRVDPLNFWRIKKTQQRRQNSLPNRCTVQIIIKKLNSVNLWLPLAVPADRFWTKPGPAAQKGYTLCSIYESQMAPLVTLPYFDWEGPTQKWRVKSFPSLFIPSSSIESIPSVQFICFINSIYIYHLTKLICPIYFSNSLSI